MKKRNKKNRISLNPKRICLPLVGLVLGLVMVQLLFSYRCAGLSEQLAQLEQEASELDHTNQLLVEANAKLGALNRIQARASELGFTRQLSVVYLTPSAKVALGY